MLIDRVKDYFSNQTTERRRIAELFPDDDGGVEVSLSQDGDDLNYGFAYLEPENPERPVDLYVTTGTASLVLERKGDDE